MTTLDRYIARSLVLNTVILLAVLFSFVVMVDVSLNSQRFLSLAADRIREQSGAQEVDGVRRVLVALLYVADLWWPRLLQLYNFIVPLILCGSVGFTFVQLVRHREVVAALAGGISLYRLARPAFAVAALFVGLQVVNQELVLPRIAPLLARSNYDAGKRELDSFPVRLVADGQRRLFLARSFDPGAVTLTDLNVWERDETGRAVARVTAQSAAWSNGAWRLSGGVRRALSLSATPVQGPTAGNDPRQAVARPVAELRSDLDPTTLLAEHYRSFSQSLSWGQIADVLATPNLKPDVREQMLRVGVGRVSLIACTFLTLAMVLTFFLVREPRNMLWQALKASPVAIGAIVGSVLGTSAALPGVPAEYSVFIPVLVLAPLAVGLVSSVRS